MPEFVQKAVHRDSMQRDGAIFFWARLRGKLMRVSGGHATHKPHRRFASAVSFRAKDANFRPVRGYWRKPLATLRPEKAEFARLSLAPCPEVRFCDQPEALCGVNKSHERPIRRNRSVKVIANNPPRRYWQRSLPDALSLRIDFGDRVRDFERAIASSAYCRAEIWRTQAATCGRD